MFVRQSGGVLIATSYDGGQTWAPDMPRDPTLVAPTPYGGCQQSVINYSHPIDGKPAVIFANAAANSRSNGTIRIGLINENGTKMCIRDSLQGGDSGAGRGVWLR